MPNDDEAKPIAAGPTAGGERSRGGLRKGRISRVFSNSGFIAAGEQQVFFSASEWLGKLGVRHCRIGGAVEFRDGSNKRGPCAVQVRPLGEDRDDEPREVLVGVIKELRGSYGFIALEVGESLFFHRSGCAEGNRFSRLREGDRVRCRLHVDAAGQRRAEAVELYSGS